MIDGTQPAENAVSSDVDTERLKPDRPDQTAGRIVVGIGDSDAGHYLAALHLAARMSRQRELTITLVHGCLPRLSIAPSGSEALQRHVAHGLRLVEEAGLALSPMVDASTQIGLAAVPMSGVDALLQESQTAEALIVQHRNLSTVSRAFSSATSHTVAAQSECPVLVVRHDQLDTDSKRGIVVGIGPHSGGRALEVGVVEATARKCPLIAVYVWDLPFSPTYGGRVDPDDEELAEANRWADSFLARAVAKVATRHPDVEFHARTVRGVIEDGLLQECEHAELVIVERHRDAHLASIGLGALTRHLIDHAPCPVMITPHSDAMRHSYGAGATEPKITTES
jgi:nucleotide-binding universal stress UspA family protein